MSGPFFTLTQWKSTGVTDYNKDGSVFPTIQVSHDRETMSQHEDSETKAAEWYLGASI